MDQASLSAGGDCRFESCRALSRFAIQESGITSSQPSIAQLVEHLTVDQMVPGSIPGRRILCSAQRNLGKQPSGAPAVGARNVRHQVPYSLAG